MEYYRYNYFKIRLLVYAFVVLALSGVAIWRIQVEQGRTRDVQRVADALRIQAAFEKLYLHDRSYAAAAEKGCEVVGQSVRRCRLRDYEEQIAELTDPGDFDYVVSRVPDRENFGVTFTLEHAHKSLAKGEHTISAEGIK